MRPTGTGPEQPDLQASSGTTTEEDAIPRLVDRMTAMFARKGYPAFEKWRIARTLRDRILEDPDAVPQVALDRASTIFAALNDVVRPQRPTSE